MGSSNFVMKPCLQEVEESSINSVHSTKGKSGRTWGKFPTRKRKKRDPSIPGLKGKVKGFNKREELQAESQAKTSQVPSMGSFDAKYPWTSTVNVANFVTVKPCLEEKEWLINFSIWKKQMVCLLESQGVLGFINGESLPPQEDNAAVPSDKISSNEESDEQKLWRRTDRLVQGWILGSIGNDVLGAVWKLETAGEVWSELDKIFNLKAKIPEVQYDGDTDAQEEAAAAEATGRVLNKYLQLYKAEHSGDWKTAEKFFHKHEQELQAITLDKETALHVAVTTEKSNYFVQKLVELMPPDQLALENVYGETALHYAAMFGNTKAARILVENNRKLLYITNFSGELPVRLAVNFERKNTLEYLISEYKRNDAPSPFQGRSGIKLFIDIINSQFFDVALDLVETCPDLARLRCGDDQFALLALANLSSAFRSGERLSWWQKLIYGRIPLQWPKCAQAKFVSGDIENNVCCNAPLYKKISSSFQILSVVAQKFAFMIWEVIECLVPQVKDIKIKKAKHQQALELAKCLCKKMQSSDMFNLSILKAAELGISEIVEVIKEMYPDAIFAADENGMNIILLAACNRFENVLNLFYGTNDWKYRLSGSMDFKRNSLMHVCGKLAPHDRLNLVAGAALQMQRELQWFKKMEELVYPTCRIKPNNDGKTARVIFTEEHRLLKEAGERWMKETSEACTVAAALIATVVFAAAFTVPGGIKPETGLPFFCNRFAFVLFAVSDAVSLFTSITSLLMFLSILNSRYAEEDFLHVLPKRLSIGLFSLFISITFMMVAFSATLYLIFKGKLERFLIPVVALGCLPVTSFVLLQFPLLADVICSTYGPGIFRKRSDRILYLLTSVNKQKQ